MRKWNNIRSLWQEVSTRREVVSHWNENQIWSEGERAIETHTERMNERKREEERNAQTLKSERKTSNR